MDNKKKRIVFITGTRADYGKMKSLMQILDKDEQFEVFIFVCGMHLLKTFGNTYEEIVKDGYTNIHVAYGLCIYRYQHQFRKYDRLFIRICI